MLRILIAKDLRRAWRNPLPWLINLAIPLCITALIGLAFGGHGGDKASLGRIKFAVVDEDDSLLTGFLRGAVNQREGGEYLDPVFLKRDEALRELNANKLSAVFIIPTNFTRAYLSGTEATRLELIKNPAQSIHPTVLDELFGAVATALNGISRNFSDEFAAVRSITEGKSDHHAVAALVERVGDKLTSARDILNPPLISYTKEVTSKEDANAKASGKSGPGFSLFAYLLAGMAGMFLLFQAHAGMEDLPRELRQRTFERYHTLQQRLLPFVMGKALFTGVMLLICAAVMFGGGALVFRIHWQHPVAFILLTFCYAGFAASLMAALFALLPDERRGGALTNIIAMGLGLAGGCAFPPEQLPALLRDHVTPWLPTNWYVDAVRGLQSGWISVAWGQVSLKLVVVSMVLLGLAALVLQRRLRTGVRV